MKSGFKDPIADKPSKKMKSPWDFTCPKYDERSSCYVNAGSHHGVGYKQPVGHTGNPKPSVDTLPKTAVQTRTVDDILNKNLDIECQY